MTTLIARRYSCLYGFFTAVLLGSTVSAGPSGRWLGQDGHDFVGHAAQPIKSDVQDIHFILDGLPARSKIVRATIHGRGSGEWKFNGPPNSWLALIVTAPGGTKADVYLEPCQVETGRPFEFEIGFDDGSTAAFEVRGGKADPNLRMPNARMAARWIGQNRLDHAASSPNAGPDGIQDVEIALSKLSPKDGVKSIVVDGRGAEKWIFGPNHEGRHGAEFLRDAADPKSGDLFFHPTSDLTGRPLKITLTYESGKVDTAIVTGGKSDPLLKVAVVPTDATSSIAIKATWLGQTGSPGGRLGDVRVSLEGLPAKRIVGASLGDSVAGWWTDLPTPGRHGSLPLTFRRGADPSKAELAFPPVRDETGTTMTLRIAFADGKSAIADFSGGPCDPALRSPGPDGSRIEAKPGDDLQALVERFGTIELTAGTYRLDRPLVLNKPVTITSAGGATLLFAQPPAGPAWTAAIKIHAGRTLLDGFAIRFAGPVRWDRGVSYGPAVIGTTDDRDRSTGAILSGLRFTRLHIVGSPASGKWENAEGTLRLVGATDGVIERNVFKGGSCDFWNGPWRVVDNRHDGTLPGTFTFQVFAGHEVHDVEFARNRSKPVDSAGKTWRWLLLTNRGAFVRIHDNVIEGVGPRDNDPIPHQNTPETILTESYRLNFEGKTVATSADGRILTVARPQGGPAEAGAVVAILSGPQAGQWRRIVEPISPTTYLLDRPVALGGGAVAIARGFVETSFENNTIDARGSTLADPLVLGGNHFGTKVVGNRISGGGNSFRILATPSESPVRWGWSFNPMFGLQIERNTIEDGWRPSILAVEHAEVSRGTRGRVYLTASVRDNIFRWTEPVLAAYAKAHQGGIPVGLRLGVKPSDDPANQVVSVSGNRREGGRPGPWAKVHMTTVDGRPMPTGELSESDAASGIRPTPGSARR